MHTLSLSQITAILCFSGIAAGSNSASSGAAGANGDFRSKERTPVFFGSEKEAMQSREFKKCSFSNTCLLIRNGYDADLAIWGEITVGSRTQFVCVISIFIRGLTHPLNISIGSLSRPGKKSYPPILAAQGARGGAHL